MKNKTQIPRSIMLSVFGTISLSILLSACSSVSADTKAASKAKTTTNDLSTRTPAYNRKWVKTPFGPYVSAVNGNSATGKHITLIRFPAGMKTPVHTHSHDYVGVVITGVTRHYEPGKKSTMGKLPTGSHWAMPANVPHVSECFEGSGECIMAIYQDANFDFKPQ